MPEKVRNTYISLINGLRVRSTIAGGLGKAYGEPTGIPQGDPMSTVIVALMLWKKTILEKS